MGLRWGFSVSRDFGGGEIVELFAYRHRERSAKDAFLVVRCSGGSL